MRSVLLVDDDAVIRSSLRRLLVGTGMSVTEAGNGEDALALLDEQRFEAIVLDYVMPGMTGDEVLRRIRRNHVSLPVLIFSATNPDVEGLFSRLGATRICPKPGTAALVASLLDVLSAGVRHDGVDDAEPPA